MLIPAGTTLVKIGKQAKWPSVALWLCDHTILPLEIHTRPSQVLQLSKASLLQGLFHLSRVHGLILRLVWLEAWTADGGLISIPASTYKPNGMCVRPEAVSGEAGEHVLLENEECTLPLKLHHVQSCSLVAGKRSVLSPADNSGVLFLHRAIQNNTKTATHLRHLGVCECVLLSVPFM